MKLDIYTMFTIFEISAIILFFISFAFKKQKIIARMIRIISASVVLLTSILRLPANIIENNLFFIQMLTSTFCLGYIVFGILTIDYNITLE